MSKINHPVHYGGKENPFEPIKIIEHYNLNFSLGNAIKYILRAGKKGDEMEDLDKAIWYLKRHRKNVRDEKYRKKWNEYHDNITQEELEKEIKNAEN